jgi:lipopolysaccharide transport system permease protein
MDDHPATAIADRVIEPGTPRVDPRLVYVVRRPAWMLVNFAELWRYRELFWAIVLRDIKVRYRQTLVGVAWAVLQPLTTALIFVLLFGLLGKVPADVALPYGLFVFPGVIIWQMFSGTLSHATVSLVGNQQLLSKVYFPRLILPLTSVVLNLLDFMVGFVVLIGLFCYYGIAPPWTIVLLPFFILYAAIAALSFGIWLAALNAMYRDVGHLVPFLMQIGFFLTPVVYAANTLVPARWQPFLAMNPMVGVVEGFRWAVLGTGDMPVMLLCLSGLMLGLILLGGLAYFRRIEGVIADSI